MYDFLIIIAESLSLIAVFAMILIFVGVIVAGVKGLFPSASGKLRGHESMDIQLHPLGEPRKIYGTFYDEMADKIGLTNEDRLRIDRANKDNTTISRATEYTNELGR